MSAGIVQPRQIIIGAGASLELVSVLRKLALQRPFIVTDAFMVECGNVARLTARLDHADMEYTVFSDIAPNPTSDAIENAMQRLMQHAPDCVVALGGGSPIDSAKAIAFLARFGGQIQDYEAPATHDIPGLPLIAIPTTAGTGSESTRFIRITDADNDKKILCTGAAFCPTIALVDFELTLSKPPQLTAATGLDALTHAIEAYVSTKQNPFTNGLAQLAMTSLGRHLRTAYNEPGNRIAREALMLAATQAGLAFSNSSVGLVHGMSRPIEAFFHLSHGLTSAMLLPTVTEFSIPSARARYADCARFIGMAASRDSDVIANQKLLDGLQQLNVDLNIPTPKRYGIDKDRYFSLVPTMTEQALASGLPFNNPRAPSVDEISRLYTEVWE